MRITKLFSVGVETKEEADNLKKELSEIKIEEIEDGVKMSYSGYITCDISVKDKIEVLIYTYLDLHEFNDLIFKCCNHPNIFQFDNR